MSGHLDGPPPGPPDPPYIPGDLGAPSAKEFARRRASPTPEERNPYAPSADWKPGQDTFTSQAAGIWAEGFAAGRAAASPDERLREAARHLREKADQLRPSDSFPESAAFQNFRGWLGAADELDRLAAADREKPDEDQT